MQAVYRKLLEIEIRHDYFLLKGTPEKYPADYDISSVINIVPSDETAKIMRDHRMLFRSTASGFIIFIQAEPVSGNRYVSIINFDPAMVLSFYWSLREHQFINYTNHRLLENTKKIYYFSNKDAFVQNPAIYLNTEIASFGTTYQGEADYQLGDIIETAGETYEMIAEEAPILNFAGNADKWKKINTSVINYVNPSDRLDWQFPIFRHQRTNTNPGELIKYKLFDVNNQLLELGLIPGTNLPQSEYLTSLDPAGNVNYSLDLSSFGPGKYSLEIDQVSGIQPETFYLLDPIRKPDLFCVSEFFVTAPQASFQFTKKDTVTKRWLLDNPHKKFLIRFRNRSTKWRYLHQDQSELEPPVLRPLTREYSGYEISIGGRMVKMPDPSVDTILPELTPTTPKLLKNIFSNIFLIK